MSRNYARYNRAPALERDDVEALRRATYIVLRFNPAEPVGPYHILAWLKKSSPRDFTDAEWRIFNEDDQMNVGKERIRTIPVEGAIMDYDCGPDDHGWNWAAWTVYPGDDEWQAVLQVLKPGHSIFLDMVAGNSNGYMSEAGLTEDYVKLKIRLEPMRYAGFKLDNRITQVGSYGRPFKYRYEHGVMPHVIREVDNA